LARAQSVPHRQVLRARVLLSAADGVANNVIADEVGVTPTTVRAWRKRFAEDGLAGLEKIREGRKPSIPEETTAEIVRLTTTTTPAGCHPLVVPDDGQDGRSQFGDGAKDLVRSGFGAAPG
jgi:transposase